MDTLSYEILNNDLLFGKDKEENIVGAYQFSDTHIRLFFRNEGKVSHRDEQFYPFFFLSERSLLEGFIPEENNKYWIVKLNGNNFYRFLAIFSCWKDFRSGLEFINGKNRGLSSEPDSSIPAPSLIPLTYSKGDAVTQYLLQSGKTMFKGLDFSSLRRMQLDIETCYDPNKRRIGSGIGEDEIIIVSLSDNTGWESVIHSKNSCEKELLEKLVDLIIEKDPDVIEGHNIFSFDLPYLQKRCDFHGINFAIGRDRTPVRSYPSSIRFAERIIDYPYYDIPGRHVIDTLFLVQGYDVSKRAMQSYGLKAVAKFFGFASPERTYIEYKDIISTWKNNPDKLLAYALDDVRETRALASHLSGSNYYLSRMMPYTYAMTSRLGQAAKIEALFIREYLRQKHSVPKPSAGQQHSGGYTEVFLKGILGPIVYADVESLYPSIMLTYGICPKTDDLRVFQGVLGNLKDLRLKTKKLSGEEKLKGNLQLADNFDAMQGSFKILINAMYGYLGFNNGIFNDFDEADKVTTTGQGIAKKMILEFEGRGCKVIEVDTDGILFVPPSDITTEEAERSLVREVSALMPDGINIGYDGRYKKMISYMKKNYALLDYDNVMIIKGSSLTSRSSEKFGRDFVKRGFEKLLSEDITGLHDLYTEYKEKILAHALDITDFSRTETLKTSMEQYLEDVRSGRRSKSVTYEIALKAGRQVTKGERLSYYISGSGGINQTYDKGKLASDWKKERPDDNTVFYLKRLDEHSQKFLPFFKPQDYSTIFSSDTLFSFSPEGIELIKEIINVETDTSGYTG
jgi:DNA polymerase, archaea type